MNENKTIHFINGDKFEVTQKVADVIGLNIAKGKDEFQVFTNEIGVVCFIINLKEVSSIR